MFLFKKQVFYFIFSFHGKYIELENESQTTVKELEFSSQQFAVMEEFGKQIKDKIRLKFCDVYYNIGAGDALKSAMICGFVNQIFLQLFLVVKSKKPTASLCVYDTVSYNKVCCEIALVTQISMSFFDIVYSYIYSVIITRKKK